MLLKVENLRKYYPVHGLLRKKGFVRAVDGISFGLDKGEVLSLVGESGCGKTTTGRIIVGLERPTEGRIVFEGKEVVDWKPIRRFVQMIFQDPYASLNPKMSIGEHLTEPLIVHGFDRDEAFDEAIRMLERVGLTPAEEFYLRFPWQLSGGQRQRVAIARAMILKPKLVVADEPVSMIDVSLRASILNLLMSFKSEYGLSMLFISHDLSVSRLISDGIAVMYLGKIVEMGDVDSVIENPLHPYTKALLSAVPSFEKRIRFEIKGDVADPKNPPKGCRLHPRCPLAKDVCRREEPEMVEVEKNHFVACHLVH